MKVVCVISLSKGPLCVPTPEVPFDGFLNISSPVHDVEIVDTCQIDGENLYIVCPSFLNIFIRSATYGRKAKGKTVCTGAKDPGPAEDCLNTKVLSKARSLCHGNYSCSIEVSGSLADISQSCNTNAKELNTTHTCGKHDHTSTVQCCTFAVDCYPWRTYGMGEDCAATALAQNGWIGQEQLRDMGGTDQKEALITNLNNLLDSEIHSVPELSYRFMISLQFSNTLLHLLNSLESCLIIKVGCVA